MKAATSASEPVNLRPRATLAGDVLQPGYPKNWCGRSIEFIGPKLYLCRQLAGILLVILGATGLGTAVKFIARPFVVGFTNDIAVLIASAQIKEFFDD